MVLLLYDPATPPVLCFVFDMAERKGTGSEVTAKLAGRRRTFGGDGVRELRRVLRCAGSVGERVGEPGRHCW